jgi:tetratricopeptide (TPR) repeat protein
MYTIEYNQFAICAGNRQRDALFRRGDDAAVMGLAMETSKAAVFGSLLAEASTHQRAGRLSEAEKSYRAALAVVPGHTAVTHNLGVLAAARDDQAAALQLFEESLLVEPHYVSAHYNRAVALNALGRSAEATEALRRVISLEPGHYAGHRALAFHLLGSGDRGRALDHFARTYELRRGDDRTDVALRSLTWANRSKLLHDAEQFDFLAQSTRNGWQFGAMARNYRTIGATFSQAVTPLSAGEWESLGDNFNTAIHRCDAPEMADGAVCRRPDTEGIESAFASATVGAVYFDDFITPRALTVLRRYLLESTIWHDFSHIGGFVASYLEDGLACPLLLQIADEARAAFPHILGPLVLTQAWAFKGLSPTSTVDLHADGAEISINFWLTPSEANQNPEHGGLVVYRVAPPPDWTIEGYGEDRPRIVSFLEQDASSRMVIPYRANRAVLFESRLFHHSDNPDFAEGYQNNRINITLLYGKSEGKRSLRCD